MSTLKEKADEILAEKEEKIIPQNIKEGVTIFDVTGTYSGGGSSDILVFNTKQEMVSYGVAERGIKALINPIYSSTTYHGDGITKFKTISFPSSSQVDIAILEGVLIDYGSENEYNDTIRFIDGSGTVLNVTIDVTGEVNENEEFISLSASVRYEYVSSVSQPTELLALYTGSWEVSSGAEVLELSDSVGMDGTLLLTDYGTDGMYYDVNGGDLTAAEDILNHTSNIKVFNPSEVYESNGEKWVSINAPKWNGFYIDVSGNKHNTFLENESSSTNNHNFRFSATRCKTEVDSVTGEVMDILYSGDLFIYNPQFANKNISITSMAIDVLGTSGVILQTLHTDFLDVPCNGNGVGEVCDFRFSSGESLEALTNEAFLAGIRISNLVVDYEISE